MKALTYWHQFEPQVGASLYSWLFVIMRNEWRSRQRRNRVRYTDNMDELECLIGPSQQDALELKEALRSPHSPIVIDIAQGLPYKDVAKKYNLPIGTVKSRVNRCRQKMREAGL